MCHRQARATLYVALSASQKLRRVTQMAAWLIKFFCFILTSLTSIPPIYCQIIIPHLSAFRP